MTKDLIRKLSNAHGIPGSEGNIQDIIRAEVAPHADEIRTDPMGNLIAIREGGPLKVMLAAHMDEIGLMVKYIDDDGFLRFVTLGGWYAPTLYNQRVVVHGTKKALYGVVGGKPPHALSDEDRKKELKVEDMFIDIGVSSRKEAEKLGVEIGSAVSIDRACVDLAGSRITGKAFDNRVGVALLIRVLQEARTRHTLIGVFTVQEEVGTKGAKTSAYRLEPDCAIATDVTFPGDHPGIEKKDSSLEVGKGPSITISDANGRGLIAQKKMVDWLRSTAAKTKIPVQLNVGKGGTTDATAIHLERGGIPSTVLEIPVRYIHSPVEVMDMDDFEKGVRLLVAALDGAPDL
jgi:endoglucanase